MRSPSPPVCQFCGVVLQELHGHGECQTVGCPLHGVVQEDCCTGAPLAPDVRDAERPIANAPIPWKPRES